MKLSSLQRKYLRAEAHHLKPSVYIGKNQLNKGSIHSIDNSLTAHELIKVKFLGEKVVDKDKSIITDNLDCNIVASIGKVLIVYRQNKDKDKQKIQLPR